MSLESASKEQQSKGAVLTGELVIISGRYRGRRVPLRHETLRIGRDRTCELALDDEAASRVHSEIIRKNGSYLLRDLQSTNGTFLNDARVTESPLQNGDRIGVGDTVMLLQLDLDATREMPHIIFTKDQKPVSARYSLNLNETRFLQLKEDISIPDAQKQFTLLYEFIVDVAGILHLPALLERSLTHFLNAFGADRGLIMLLTPEGEAGIKVTRVREGVMASEDISISRTMAQHLLEKKESFLSVNADSDQRLAGAESIHNMKVFSIMGLPLKVKDKVTGMMYFDTVSTGKAFTEDDLKLCTAMALQLAVCVENTRLYNELLDAAEFNNSILRSLKSGIVVVDMNGRILRINHSTQETLGKTETQLLGRSLKDFPEFSDLQRLVDNTLSTGLPEDRYEVQLKVGSEILPLGMTSSVLTDHAGKVIGAVLNFRNLQAIRRLEEQVRRSHHLAALGQMAAGVAHEVRNPLNSIRGFAQLLQEKTGQDAACAEYTQIILEEVDRMNRIVQDLLDFSRQRDLTLVPVPIEKLIEDLVREMKGDAQKANVELKILPPTTVLPNIFGNSDKLRQVFRNVILNAIQACAKEGKVEIRMGIVADTLPPRKDAGVESAVSRRQVAVDVIDNGCGIDSETIEKIFDPFFTNKDTGTGLGLSISQKIVDQHGGRIDVKSEVGKGTTFTIILPAL